MHKLSIRLLKPLFLAVVLSGLAFTFSLGTPVDGQPPTTAATNVATAAGEIRPVTLAAEKPRQLIPSAGASLHAASTDATEDYSYDPTSAYDQKGTNAPRGFTAQAPDELIDPFSGNLIIRHVDLALPGVAGLDLVLQRVYNSKIHRNYAARATNDPGRIQTGMLFVPPSPLGLGWTMHLGRIVGGVSSAPNEFLAGPRYYEASDGSQQSFYTFSGPGCGNADDICLVTKGFDNPYQLEEGGPWYMATADGLNMTFAHTAFDGSSIVHYATEIRDVHGNHIEILYHDETIPGINVQRDYFNHFIDSITDSAGRNINFGYQVVNSPDVVALTSITAVGRTYRYGYTNSTPWGPSYAFLNSAQPPAGAPWRYGYDGLNNGDCANNGNRWCELTDITYPAGGTIAYTFEDLTFFAQANPMSVRAITRRVMGGREIDTATWTYQYNREAQYNGSEHTVITRPDNSQEVYTYFGIGERTYNPNGQAWKMGALLQKRLRQGSSVVQTETYTWVASPAISGELVGDYWIGFDSGVFLPRMQSYTIERGSLRWTTTHTSYNNHNNTPRCSTETGDGATRYLLNTFTSLSLEQGDRLFTFASLPATAGISYTPFSDANCDPQQASSWAPDIVDERVIQEFDGEGQMTSHEINGKVTDFQYHANGTLKAEITYRGTNRVEGYCTAYGNYQHGMPRQTIYGATAPACSSGLFTTQRVLNPDGSVQRETDGRNNSTEFVYDGLGRHTQITPPGQAPIVITYDGGAGSPNTQRRVEQAGYWIEERFDGFNRPVGQESSAGIHSHQTYDALDRMTFRSLRSTSAGNSVGETFTYDALGRTLTATHDDGTGLTYDYAANPHTVTITDEAGRATVHTRRAFANPNDYRIIRVQLPGEPEPTTDTYAYLAGGHLSSINYGGRQRTIEYTFAKQVSRITEPESGTTYYGYDAAGNLRCRHWTPLCNDFNYDRPGTDIRYQVNGVGRITQIDYSSGGSVVFTYDNANNIETMTDATGSHMFEYNAENQVRKRTSIIEGVTYVTEYGYDNSGNLDSIKYPSGRTVTYERDSGNRISDIPGYVSNIQYHPNGMISSMTYANGVVTTLSLDPRQRPDRLQATGILNLNYDYDPVNNLDRLVDSLNTNNTTDFDYDDLNRLTDASGAWGNLHYDYNAAGDRTGERMTLAGDEAQVTTYSYDGDGLLESLSGRVNLEYSYDSKGNVRSRGEFSYQYDAENRINRVSDLSGSISFVYDGFGHKTIAQRFGCQNSRVYHYDQEGNRIAEYSLEGTLLKEYVNLEERIVAELRYPTGSVSPDAVDFGEVEVHTTVTRTISISNPTDSAITLDALNVPFPFGLAVEEPVVIPANSNFELPLTFRPFQRGRQTAHLEACAAGGLRVDIALEGKGVAAIATIVPPELDLGDVAYGLVVSDTFVVSNTGDYPLHITEWSADSDALSVAPAGAATLQPGQAQEMILFFDSTHSCGGVFSGAVYPTSNSNPGGANIAVSANVRALEVDASDMLFGPLNPGESRTLNVTLRNYGAVPLTPMLHFNGGPQFSAGNLPAATLAPNASVEIPVTYQAGDKLWSPFGDHAMLQTGFLECPLVCTASAHMIGNSAIETVPQGGTMPSVALLGNSAHVTSISTDTIRYATRDSAGAWTQESTPATGASRNSAPVLVAGPNGRLTALWDEPFTAFEMKLRQRVPPGDWGDVCTLEGFRRGPDPIATDAAGTVWLTWLNRADFGLNVAPIVSDSGVCQADQTPAFVEPGFAWDSLYLASGPAGYLGMTLTEFERLRFFDLDLANTSATKETPVNTELNFGTSAAIAVDGQQGWHLLWAPIETGVEYTAPATYLYRQGSNAQLLEAATGDNAQLLEAARVSQGWGQPVTLMDGSQGAMSLQIAVDSVGGVHAAWSDLACAAQDQRKIYYATRPAFSNSWQVSDVSTPGYAGFEQELAMVLDNDQLAAVWHGNQNGQAGVLLYGLAETGALVGGSGLLSDTIGSGGGSLTADDGHIEIEFPPGAVSEATDVVYTRQSQPSESTGNLRFAGLSFRLEATDTGGPVTQFDPAIRLTLQYEDADWQVAGIEPEANLNLYYWDGNQWQGVLPCDGCSLDTDTNTLIALLDHLTEFGLLGPLSPTSGQGEKLFMPLVGSGE